MHSRGIRALALLLIFPFLSSLVLAQKDSTPSPKTPPPPNENVPNSTNNETSTTAAAAAKPGGPLGDFVPCLFTGEEQFQMRALPIPASPPRPADGKTIGPFAAVDLVHAIDDAIEQYGAYSDYSVEVFDSDLNERLTAGKLAEQSPAGAYDTINNAAVATADLQIQQIDQYFEKYVSSQIKRDEILGEGEDAEEKKQAVVKEIVQEMLQRVRAAASQLLRTDKLQLMRARIRLVVPCRL